MEAGTNVDRKRSRKPRVSSLVEVWHLAVSSKSNRAKTRQHQISFITGKFFQLGLKDMCQLRNHYLKIRLKDYNESNGKGCNRLMSTILSFLIVNKNCLYEVLLLNE